MFYRCAGVTISAICVSLFPLAVLGDIAEQRLAFDPVEPSFGLIDRYDGHDRYLVVRVRNASRTPLKLKRASMGCGCMEATIEQPDELAPGETATIRVRLRIAEASIGVGRYALTILDDRGIAGSRAVTYEYRPSVFAVPRQISVTPESAASGTWTTTRIHVASIELMRRLQLRKSSSLIEATMAEISADPPQLQLRARVLSSHPVGPIEAHITVLDSQTAETKTVIPLRGNVPLPVAVRPEVILLGDSGGDNPVLRKLSLSNSSNETYRFVTARTSSPVLKVQTHTIDGSVTGFDIIVSVKDSQEAGSLFQEEVTLIFEGPQSFSIVVPIVGELP